jgi:Protein of unknown function (DUF669)
MATKRKVSGKGDGAVVVDFTDTESREGKKGSRSAHLPEGDYTAKVKEAKLGKSSEKETPGILMTWIITGPKKYKGKTIRDSLWLSDKALWRVRQTLEALGVPVPSKKVKVDPRKMVGKEAAITLEDEEYEGKVRSRVTDCFLLSEYEELQEDTDEELDEDEDEEEDEDEDTDDDDDDEDEDDDDEEEEIEDVDLDSI